MAKFKEEYQGQVKIKEWEETQELAQRLLIATMSNSATNVTQLLLEPVLITEKIFSLAREMRLRGR